MPTTIQKLLGTDRNVAREGLKKTAANCRAAADRYRACAAKLIEASKCFDDGLFDDGYRCLVEAEEAFKGN